jgi:ABC-type uncharacterized transport system ATPase subunit
MPELAVNMSGITKTFGDKVTANRSVDFFINKSEIHALVGENGAGKSTLMKILYGMHSPDSGSIEIFGNHVRIGSPSDAIKLGIGMVHQHFMLVNPLSVEENIILGNEDAKKFGILDYKSSENKIAKLVHDFSIDIDIKEKIENLPIGLQQKVEILKILYRNAEILILDEPTAVLTPQETDTLFGTLKELKSQGKTIILITHKLDEVMQISDSVTVLRRGEVTGRLNTKDTSIIDIARLMVGEELPEEERKKTIPGSEILKVTNLTVLNDKGTVAVKNISFSVNGGEIFGIAGVEGNGQTELIEAVTSLRETAGGEITVEGNSIGIQTVSHIPSDRHKNGIVMDFSISENVMLGRQNEKKFTGSVFIKESSLNNYTAELIEAYDIRPSNPLQKIKELSGGNQQKVVAAREMTKDTKLIAASHPTRGLDIKASGFVNKSLFKAKTEGKAILLVSSDLKELLSISDRIAVLYKGEIVVTLDADKTNERELGMYMTGAKQ